MTPPLVDDFQQLVAHANRSVELSHSKLSPARKKVIADMIARIAADTFETVEQRQLWISLLGIESSYDGTARSSKGAVGIGQLLPKYREDFGASCGLTGVSVSDLSDDHTNAVLSSCYYRWLISQNNGDTSLALVAYVSGQYSKDHANAKEGKPTSETARSYVEKITRNAHK